MYESFGNRLYNLAGDISPYYTHNRWVRFTLNDEQNGTETGFLDCGTVSSDGCAFGQKITANGGLTLASGQTADFSAGAVKLPTYTTGSITPTAVTAQNCSSQTFTVTGLIAGGHISTIIPPADPGNLSMTGWISAANTLTLHFCNPSAASVTPPSGAYTFTAAAN